MIIHVAFDLHDGLANQISPIRLKWYDEGGCLDSLDHLGIFFRALNKFW